MLYEKEIYQFSSGEFINVRIDIDNVLERISLNIDIDDIMNLRNKKNITNLDNTIFSKCSDIRITRNLNKNKSRNNVIEFRIPNGTLNKETVNASNRHIKKISTNEAFYRLTCDSFLVFIIYK